MTTLSIALTTYNGQKFLPQQLDSLVSQTRLPDELIVTDDQSTDGTWAILTQFAATAPFPVRLYRNETRLGFRHNFMHALSMCTSDLVALCDQDDVWDPEKLATAVAAMAQPDVVLFFHNAWLIDSAGVRIREGDLFVLPACSPPLSIYSPYSPFGFSIVFARSLLQFSDLWAFSRQSDYPNFRAPHDQWLFFLATIFGTIVYSDQRLADYRVHSNNTVGPPATAGTLPISRAAWMYWLTSPAWRFRSLAASARDRAAILAKSQERLTGVWHERAVAGEQRCSQLAALLECRARLYESRSLTDRLAHLVKLYRSGTYRDGSGWGFRRSAAIKDAVLGLLLGPRLLRPEANRGA